MIGPSANTTMDATLSAQDTAPAATDTPVRLPQGGRLLDYAILLKPRAMFRYSILHLFLIFVVLLGDHYVAPFFH